MGEQKTTQTTATKAVDQQKTTMVPMVTASLPAVEMMAKQVADAIDSQGAALTVQTGNLAQAIDRLTEAVVIQASFLQVVIIAAGVRSAIGLNASANQVVKETQDILAKLNERNKG